MGGFWGRGAWVHPPLHKCLEGFVWSHWSITVLIFSHKSTLTGRFLAGVGGGFFILFFLDMPTNPTISQILFLWCHDSLLYSTATNIYSPNISTKLSRVIPSPKSLAMSVIKNLSWLCWRKELAHWVKNCALLKKQFYKKWSASQKKANRLIFQKLCPGSSNFG